MLVWWFSSRTKIISLGSVWVGRTEDCIAYNALKTRTYMIRKGMKGSLEKALKIYNIMERLNEKTKKIFQERFRTKCNAPSPPLQIFLNLLKVFEASML